MIEEQLFVLHWGRMSADIARERLWALQQVRAYLERTDGQTAQARPRLIDLIREWPFRSSCT